MSRLRVVTVVAVLSLSMTIVPPRLVPAEAVVCPTGALCVVVDAATDLGAAKLRAQGFLMGYTDQTPTPLVTALKPQFWRSTDRGPQYNGLSTYDLSRATGAKMTYLMITDWAELPGGGHHSQTWSCTMHVAGTKGVEPPFVAGFVTYDAFLNTFLPTKTAKGVSWYEPENEPDHTGCLVNGRYKFLRYEEFRHINEKITTAVPGAKVVALSRHGYVNTLDPIGSCEQGTIYTDMSSFMAHAKLFNVKYAAVAWHEISSRDCGAAKITNPKMIIGHVDDFRDLVADNQPEVGHPEIHINEYGARRTFLLPGWTTGYIAALEASNVDVAGRACWEDFHHSTASTCFDPAGVVDGLFTPTGDPQADYWVHRSYADMSCPDASCSTRTTTRIATTTPAEVSAFATRDDTLESVHVLTGRHVTCTKAVNPNPSCDDVVESTPAPADATFTIGYPYGGSTARVVVKRIPNVRGAVLSPTIIDIDGVAGADIVAVVGGNVTVSLPASAKFADGDTFTIDVLKVGPSEGFGASSSRPGTRPAVPTPQR